MRILRVLLTFAFVNLLVACNLEESVNLNDPKNICGGLAASQVKPRVTNYDLKNATLVNSEIQFDLDLKVQNCTIGELNNLDVSLLSMSNATISSSSTYNFSSSLSKNQESGYVNVASLKINKSGITSDSASIELYNGSDTWTQNKSIDYSRIIPNFVAEVSNVDIVDGASLSNGDEKIDPGEDYTFRLKITGLTNVDVSNITASISSSNADFVISNGSGLSVGTINGKTSSIVSTTTTVAVGANVSRGDKTTLTATLTDQYGNSWNRTITLTVSPVAPPPPKTQVLSLNSNMTFKGFTSSSTSWHMLVLENMGNSVSYYRIYSKSPSATSWNHTCGWLSTGVRANLAVDGSYFYIGTSSGVERRNKTDCNFVANIVPSTYSYDSSRDDFNSGSGVKFSLNVDNNKLYYTSSYYLTSLDLSSGTQVRNSTDQFLGAKSFNDGYSQFFVKNDNRWAFYDSSSSSYINPMLWKFDSSNNAVAWGEFPAATYTHLQYQKAFATVDGNVFTIATEKSTGILRFYSFDVSEWSDNTDQEIQINSNLQTTSMTSSPGNCVSGYSVTSKSGCVGVLSNQTVSLNSNETFVGFGSDSSNLYMLVLEDLGNNVDYYRIYSKAPAATTWSHTCSWLSTGTARNLGVDDSFFYIGSSSGIQKRNKSDCSLSSTINPSTYSLSSYRDDFLVSHASKFTLSIDNGKLYYRDSSSLLSSYNLSTTAEAGNTTDQSLGEKSFNDYYAQFAVSGGVRWGVYDGDYYYSVNPSIWKFDSSNNALAWAELPAHTYSDLHYQKALSVIGNNIYVATEKVAKTVKIYKLDINNFEGSGSNSATSFSSASTSITRVTNTCSGYRTSSQGCVQILSPTYTTTLSTGLTFKGFTVYNTYQYMLVKSSTSNDYAIHKAPVSGGNWIFVCQFTSTLNHANIAVDSSTLYLGSTTDGIQVRSLTNCSLTSSISASSYLINGYRDNFSLVHYAKFSMSVDNGKLYYRDSDNFLSSYNLSSTAEARNTTDQSLGEKSFNDYYAQFAVSGGVRWGVYDEDYNYSVNPSIWKFDSSNNALAWAELPASIYSDLHYQFALSIVGNTAYVATEKTTGTIKIYRFDLTNF